MLRSNRKLFTKVKEKCTFKSFIFFLKKGKSGKKTFYFYIISKVCVCVHVHIHTYMSVCQYFYVIIALQVLGGFPPL